MPDRTVLAVVWALAITSAVAVGVSLIYQAIWLLVAVLAGGLLASWVIKVWDRRRREYGRDQRSG
jgi:hypothetical protein